MAEPVSDARRLTLTEGNFRAWCEGRKTQTRRVIRLPKWLTADDREDFFRALRKSPKGIVKRGPCDGIVHRFRCPYGPVGTPLYVAEPFRVVEGVEAGLVVERIPSGIGGGLVRVEYAWSRRREWTGVPASHWDTPTAQPSEAFHSSRFFPRWAAHRWSWLEGVRVQFLRDIQGYDITAEGIGTGGCADDYAEDHAKFVRLWDSINARRGYSWAGAGSEWPGYVWALTVAGPGEEAESHG